MEGGGAEPAVGVILLLGGGFAAAAVRSVAASLAEPQCARRRAAPRRRAMVHHPKHSTACGRSPRHRRRRRAPPHYLCPPLRTRGQGLAPLRADRRTTADVDPPPPPRSPPTSLLPPSSCLSRAGSRRAPRHRMTYGSTGGWHPRYVGAVCRCTRVTSALSYPTTLPDPPPLPPLPPLLQPRRINGRPSTRADGTCRAHVLARVRAARLDAAQRDGFRLGPS